MRDEEFLSVSHVVSVGGMTEEVVVRMVKVGSLGGGCSGRLTVVGLTAGSGFPLGNENRSSRFSAIMYGGRPGLKGLR